MRKFATNKKLINLSLTRKDIYKMYNYPISRKALTAFQTHFYKVQALRNYYDISSRYISKSMVNTVLNLERRLDIILVRMNLVSRINESRQIIRHGKVFVNHEQIEASNYIVTPGDLIEIKGETMNHYNKITGTIINIPVNMEVNYELRVGKYLRDAKIEEISIPISLS